MRGSVWYVGMLFISVWTITCDCVCHVWRLNVRVACAPDESRITTLGKLWSSSTRVIFVWRDFLWDTAWWHNLNKRCWYYRRTQHVPDKWSGRVPWMRFARDIGRVLAFVWYEYSEVRASFRGIVRHFKMRVSSHPTRWMDGGVHPGQNFGKDDPLSRERFQLGLESVKSLKLSQPVRGFILFSSNWLDTYRKSRTPLRNRLTEPLRTCTHIWERYQKIWILLKRWPSLTNVANFSKRLARFATLPSSVLGTADGDEISCNNFISY